MRRPFPKATLGAALLTAVSLCLLFTACTPTDRFSAGRPLTREELDAIAESIRATEHRWDPDADYPEGTVFWPRSGNAYHTDPRCKHIQAADAVFCGTVEEAQAAGKVKACTTSCLQTETEGETIRETD